MFKNAWSVWKVIDGVEDQSCVTNGEIANSSQISWPGTTTSHNHQDDEFTLVTSSACLAGIPSSSPVETPQTSSISAPKVLPLPVPSSISAILETGLAPTSYIEADSGQEEKQETPPPAKEREFNAFSLDGTVAKPETLILKVPAQSSAVMSSWPDIPTRNTAIAEQDLVNHNAVYSGGVVVQINNRDTCV